MRDVIKSEEQNNVSSPSRRSTVIDQPNEFVSQFLNSSTLTSHKFELENYEHCQRDKIKLESIRPPNQSYRMRKENADMLNCDSKALMLQFEEQNDRRDKVFDHKPCTSESILLSNCATTSCKNVEGNVYSSCNGSLITSSSCPSSSSDFDIDNNYTLDQNTSNMSNQIQNHSNRNMRQKNIYNESNNMPPLCNNYITTPTLSIQFSPFLTFSDERVTNNLTVVNLHDDMKPTPEVEENYDKSKSNNAATTLYHGSSRLDTTLSTPLNLGHEVGSMDTISSLSYADNLLLHASKGRTVTFTPLQASFATPKVSDRKRKAQNSCRTTRQPQKRFSIDLERNEIPGGDLFVSKRDGRVRLTTNLPRKVEAIDPETGERAHLYESCSEASRAMGINRTRISRSKCIVVSLNILNFFFVFD